MKKCYCGSGKEFEKCCEPFISRKKDPLTAENLMRARYSAYVAGDIDFIESTHSLEKREDLDVEETKKWSRESDWMGLEIIRTEKGGPGDMRGLVEFKASYSQNGITHIHHEISNFKKIENKWYFDNGEIIPSTVVRTGSKIGRNDPCPCGSGKKYKKCCGR